MAIEEDDQSMEPEIREEIDRLKTILDKKRLNCFCRMNMTAIMPLLLSMPVPAAQKRRTGRRCSSECI